MTGNALVERDGRRAHSADSWTAGRVLRGIRRYGVLATADCAVVFTAYLIAVGLRTGARPEVSDPVATTQLALAAGVLQVAANLLFRIYRRDWSIAALEDLVALSGASLLAAIAVLVWDVVAEVHPIPLGALVTGAPLALFGQAVLKLRPRWPQIVGAALGRRSPGDTAIVVGAGHTGQLLARDLTARKSTFRILCFVDDAPSRRGSFVRGIPVSGGLDDLPRLVRKLKPTVVVIAAPRHHALLRRVVDLCEGLDVGVRTFGTFGIHSADAAQLRAVSIGDLLARDAVDLGQSASRGYVRGRRVLITGAAGSIGSELCRQVAELQPSLLMVLDSNESGLHDLAMSLPERVAIEFLLGDIRNERWLTNAISQGRPDIVFHAAAYKHVPIIEKDPLAGISTNVIGTANVLAAAEASGVSNLVFISTDKAVSPTSVLGLTKRFGELLTIGYARTHVANFSVVRFGNVLGSAGSVVPIFTKQIDRGGPITVTDPATTRYFMTIGEAAGLVIEAGGIAHPGDLLVLDMGKPVSIDELARKMARLRGFRVPTDIAIAYIGLRPGEKLHEDLFFPDEVATPTAHPRVLRVAPAATSVPLGFLHATVALERRHVDDLQPREAVDVLRAALTPSAQEVDGGRIP